MPVVNKKPKVVIDTNVFISGLNFAGNPSEVLKLFIKGEMEVYISPFILEELERILSEKFQWSKNKVQKTLNLIKRRTTLVYPEVKVSVIKEKEDDNRILECAIESEAQYIVSGDKRHLLPLKEFRGIKILSPVKFLELFE